MCDLSQFIVSSNTTSTEDHILDHIFMPDVIMTFGMNSVVVIDDGSPFKGIFVTVCGILKLNYAYLEVIIGAALLKYHRFLNKTQAITGNNLLHQPQSWDKFDACLIHQDYQSIVPYYITYTPSRFIFHVVGKPMLFYIYTPEGTMQRRWYLFKVNPAASVSLYPTRYNLVRYIVLF